MFNFSQKKIIRLTLSDNESLDYQLIKKSKKTVSLKITEDGLVVSAPLLMVDNQNLKIFYKNLNDQMKLKKFFIKWLKIVALDYFSQRAYQISKSNSIPKNSILLTNAKTKWGSCNSKTEVRINWRLIQADPYVADYVICHEFAHLTYMNHSKNFWNLVENLCPDYKLAENYLKNKGFNLYLID